MSLTDEPPTREMLKRSLTTFTVVGFGEHKFRYAIRLAVPRGIFLCEQYLGEWRICEPVVQHQVERCIDAGLATAAGQLAARLRRKVRAQKSEREDMG